MVWAQWPCHDHVLLYDDLGVPSDIDRIDCTVAGIDPRIGWLALQRPLARSLRVRAYLHVIVTHHRQPAHHRCTIYRTFPPPNIRIRPPRENLLTLPNHNSTLEVTRGSAVAEKPRWRCSMRYSFRQEWKTGTGRKYFTDIIGLSSTTLI